MAHPAPKRRFRSKQERRQIAEESFRPGVSVAVLARAHGVNANQVFHWRKLYREGRLGAQQPAAQLLPVHITEVITQERAVETPAGKAVMPSSGTIHIELGRARLRVEGSADPACLRAILEHLGR
ncbi:MAG: transposase [Acidobacteriota bacterium]